MNVEKERNNKHCKSDNKKLCSNKMKGYECRKRKKHNHCIVHCGFGKIMIGIMLRNLKQDVSFCLMAHKDLFGA